MEIKLMNCYDEVQNFELDDKKLENFLVAVYEIVSGDETLTIVYKNGKEDFFDSDTNLRMASFYDQTTYLVSLRELKLMDRLGVRGDSYDRGEELEELLVKYRRSHAKAGNKKGEKNE